MYGNFLSNNKQEQWQYETMQRLEQSYSQDSQTKSNQSIVMKVRNNQYLIIDNRNVRIIVHDRHTRISVGPELAVQRRHAVSYRPASRLILFRTKGTTGRSTIGRLSDRPKCMAHLSVA